MTTPPSVPAAAATPHPGYASASGFEALVLANMTEGVSVTDENGIIVYTNQAEDAMFGYAAGELVGKHVSMQNAYPEEENTRIVNEVIAELRRAGVWQGEWHNRRKDGQTFFTRAHISAFEQDGKPMWLCVQRDVTQQKAEREALQRAENHLSLLLGSIGDQLVSFDSDWKYTYVNDGAVRLLQKPREELIGHSVWELFPELQGSEYHQDLNTAAQTRQPLVSEHYFAPWDVWFENRIYPAPDGITVFSSDISKRKCAEQALASSEARLQLALEAGGMGAWEWQIQTDRIAWWPGMDTLHGLPQGTQLESVDRYLDLVHPSDREMVGKGIQHSLETAIGHLLEYKIVRPDGSTRWVEGRGKIFTDSAGVPIQMSGICSDITRRKRTELDLQFVALASSELAQLVDHQQTLDRIARLAVPTFADWCAVDLLDESGVLRRVAVAHVDPAKVELAHELHRRYPPDPALPNGTWNVIRTGSAELISEISADMLEASVVDKEYLGILRELGLKSYIGAPLKTRGKTLGVVTFITAESKRLYGEEDRALAEDLACRAATAIDNSNLYRALQDADRRKDVFLATLAHELRNPLAPVSNALSIIRLSDGDRSSVDRVMPVMERQVTQLTRLVDDLMDASRITTGKIRLQKQHVSIAGILANAVESSRPHIEAAGHHLALTLPAGSTSLHGDAARLEQVFTNLLNNAAKYTEPGGRIEVIAEISTGECVIRVKDNGIGIEPGMLKEVFTMFVQANHVTTQGKGGLGIGLSLAEGLVKLHGGTIEAHSAGKGRGSEFIVCLPCGGEQTLDGSSGPAGSTGTLAVGRSGNRVLVVDDNVDAAESSAEILRLLGNEAQVVHDGTGALNIAEQWQPDVVLLDIGLPDIDGYEVARRLRQREAGRDLILVALTGWGQEKDKQQAAEAGFDHHWVKPVDLNKLKEISGWRRKA